MAKLLLLLALCGCYLKHFPITPGIANEATYKVYDDDGSGTAWAVNKHTLVTAGHMCEQTNADLIVTGEFKRFHAKVIEWEYSDTDGRHDLCVLHTDYTLPSWLVIADKMPTVGTKVAFVGYPLGKYIESSGTYLGDIDGPDSHLNDDAFSCPSDHGASGSALYDADGVWGVLVRLRTDGDYIHPGTEGGVAIPLSSLRHMLDDAGVSYDTTPGLPPRLEGNPGGSPVAPIHMLGD